MTLPATMAACPVSETAGTRRAARLMRALGPAATAVWSELDAADADRLNRAMSGTAEEASPATEETGAFLSAFRSNDSQEAEHGPVWPELDRLEPSAIARTIACEHPQLIALILSRLSAGMAAQTVRILPRGLATEALKRLMTLGRVSQDTLDLVETAMRSLVRQPPGQSGADGVENVARILGHMDPRIEQGLMASLDETEPGSAARIRALMFTFDDLATLQPAAIQTILSSIDRADLAIALKGAKSAVRQVFLSNMTKRAGEMLTAEIEAAGPVRRSQIESARREIMTIARTLARRGDILAESDAEDELVE